MSRCSQSYVQEAAAREIARVRVMLAFRMGLPRATRDLELLRNEGTELQNRDRAILAQVRLSGLRRADIG